MSSESPQKYTSKDDSAKENLTEHSNTCTSTSNYDSQYSEKQRKQRKLANRSPASRGYPKECVGNDINHVLHCKMLIINHINDLSNIFSLN